MNTWNWRDAWLDMDLPDAHARVLTALLSYMGPNGGMPSARYQGCFPSAATIGRLARYHERRVRGYLSDLDGGLITIVKRPGRSHRFEARLPDIDSDWRMPVPEKRWSDKERAPAPWDSPRTSPTGVSDGDPGSRRDATPAPADRRIEERGNAMDVATCLLCSSSVPAGELVADVCRSCRSLPEYVGPAPTRTPDQTLADVEARFGAGPTSAVTDRERRRD